MQIEADAVAVDSLLGLVCAQNDGADAEEIARL